MAILCGIIRELGAAQTVPDLFAHGTGTVEVPRARGIPGCSLLRSLPTTEEPPT